MISRAILIALFALSGLTVAQSSPAQQASSDPIQITAFPNAIFRFRQGNLKSSVTLQGDIAGCTTGSYDGSDPNSKSSGGAATTRVIDEIRKGAFWYVTFQTTLGSGCNVQGRCGAGSGITVVWLKLNARLKMISRKTVIVEDCMTDTGTSKFAGKTGDEIKDSFDPKFRLVAGKLEIEFQRDDFNTKKTTISSLRYDRRAPEKGLIVSSKTEPIK